jgi:anthranilate synthase/aminodeoxychorismate synthase-like glutamine amidotransferase
MNGTTGRHLLLVDNKDSFTYNLAQLFGSLGADVRVLRNDDPALDGDAVRKSTCVVIGPGPGRPAQAGKTLATIGWALDSQRPLLGVCLGAQAIGEYYGGEIYHTPRLMHGKTSSIRHDATGVFGGVPSPFTATRYHSLCLAERRLPAVLRANAFSEDGVIQGIAHRELPVHGVQFHPESVLTAEGGKIFQNFLDVGSM